MQVIEPLDEHQEGQLFDDRERVRYAARPEGVPDLIDLAANGSCDHDMPRNCFVRR